MDYVVFIHGAGGGAWEYDKWRPTFRKAGWTVIARDLQPAAGGLEFTTFEDYTAQVRSWLPKKWRRLVLVGASMGGPLALKVAETVRPSAIILVNPAPPLGIRKSVVQTQVSPIMRWKGGPIADTRAALPDGDEATIRWAVPRWRDESGAVLRQLREGISLFPPLKPTLVVIGEKDTDVSPSSSRATAKWADAEILSLPNTSHIGPLMGKKAARIASQLIAWIRKRLD